MQIIGADVHACHEIHMGNFPDKWVSPGGTHSVSHMGVAAPAMGPVGMLTGFRPPADLPPPTTGTTWNYTTTMAFTQLDKANSTPANKPVLIRQTDIHPTIKAFMSQYISHFRSVQFRNLLRAANVTEAMLPTLPQYAKEGKNNLCYLYVLGKCQGKICGRAAVGHVPALEIPDDFASTLCNMLAPVVEKRLATEPPTTHQMFPQTSPLKRWKRSA